MTKNISYIEKQYREYIKDLDKLEFSIWHTSLIVDLYEAFIENDEERALKSKEMIEELTEIYSEKYNNVLSNEMKKRLDIANDFLIKQLEKNYNLSMRYIETYYDELDSLLVLSNQILKALLEDHERNDGKSSKELLKDILEIADDKAERVKIFIEIHEENNPKLNKNKDYPLYWLMKTYNENQELREQIKTIINS